MFSFAGVQVSIGPKHPLRHGQREILLDRPLTGGAPLNIEGPPRQVVLSGPVGGMGKEGAVYVDRAILVDLGIADQDLEGRSLRRDKEKLNILRKQHKLTQMELANELEVTRQAVSKWESAQAQPELEKLLALSDFFQVNAYYHKAQAQQSAP